MPVLPGEMSVFFTVHSLVLHFAFMLKTVLIRDVFVIVEQALRKAKAFPASCTAMQARRLEMHGKLRGDRAGTADPNPPRGYPIAYDIMLGK